MTGMSTYSADNWLSYITGAAAMPALPVVYIALFTGVGTDLGTGFTEVTGGSYARATTSGATWNSPTGTAPSSISNSATVSFVTATANWGTIIAFGLYDSLSGGNLLAWDFLGNDPWFPFTCTNASPGVLTAIGITAGSNPVLVNGATVVATDEYGGALPTGLTRYSLNTVNGLSSDTFNVGVNTSSTGDGMIRQITQQVISSGVQASFSGGTPGSLVITAA
jgi:hypothetical protein